MHKTLLLSCIAGILAGCVAGPGPDLEMANRHLSHCVKEAGITGGYATSVNVVGADIQQTVSPGQGVSQAQADAANACLVS